jgi:hypothetical protein
MINKAIVLGSVVAATVAVALSWPGAVSGVHRERAQPSVGASPKMAELPDPRLSRVRLFVSNLN